MMNGWTEDELIDYVEHNGYWFFICNCIDDAWTRCESMNESGELQRVQLDDIDRSDTE
jgi:hypothetical protein